MYYKATWSLWVCQEWSEGSCPASRISALQATWLLHGWALVSRSHVGDCHNYGPRNTRCRIILRTQKGIITLTNTHVGAGVMHLLPEQSLLLHRMSLQFLHAPPQKTGWGMDNSEFAKLQDSRQCSSQCWT